MLNQKYTRQNLCPHYLAFQNHKFHFEILSNHCKSHHFQKYLFFQNFFLQQALFVLYDLIFLELHQQFFLKNKVFIF